MTSRGMTLVELLVVVAIMMLLVAVGAPMLRPMLEKQSQSQGAQVLRVMLLRARNMAVDKGQPFGLRLERYTAPATNAVVRLAIVREQPASAATTPPSTGWRWRVSIDNTGVPTFYEWSGTAWDDTNSATLLTDFIDPAIGVSNGALIQFWGSGEIYEVFGDGPPADPLRFVNRKAGVFSKADVKGHPGDATAVPPIPPNPGVWNGLPPTPTAEHLLAFRAIRRGLAGEGDYFPPDFTVTGIPAPVVIVNTTPMWIPTSLPPILMPEGVCVDLEFSGIGATGDELNGATGDVVVWFRADGSLDRVDYDFGDVGTRTSDKCDGLLHFLIGSWEQVAGISEDTTSTNLELPANIWVTVEPRSSRVLVNEIKVPNDAPTLREQIKNAREFANEIWNEVAAPR